MTIHVFITVPLVIALTVFLAGGDLFLSLACGALSIIGSIVLLALGVGRSSERRHDRSTRSAWRDGRP